MFCNTTTFFLHYAPNKHYITTISNEPIHIQAKHNTSNHINHMDKIDFIILWVDGNDPEWKEEKKRYENLEQIVSHTDDANSDCRFRDNDLLRYWFRGVEKFAPWVNQIHFITCGQKPEWLNTSHPKLHLINHKDYMPAHYLPTFNSCTIEMNIHRIAELSEHFVNFNDDTFLLQPVTPGYFFKKGLPILDTDLSYPKNIGYNNWSRHLFNDYCIVNKSFSIKKSISKNWSKWFNIKELGFKKAFKNYLCYRTNHTLPVSTYGHLAFPHLKSSLQEIWDLHPEIMEQASLHRFRSDNSLNQWLLCAWDQAKGKFYPTHKERLGLEALVSPENIALICDIVKNGLKPQICINDSKYNTDFESTTIALTSAFETLLPSKSSFEI